MRPFRLGSLRVDHVRSIYLCDARGSVEVDEAVWDAADDDVWPTLLDERL
jgi:hypothetical protein